ncbi:ATP-dependent Clp protease proteolytic subunit [Amycolatopsis sp.]|uniref:ATP-dependent Clp protease proteolytic subunit n=1 Tax=Amycolatopsis sp. TaxID=37632 RepID=UPI002D7E2E41|nr:ATP-dependent Clp protease proteolytic subunit [Amycolatopsis sp.]HET6710084.1 ATP-dependent Clp protease proteolytic subunit [Amycolatopsis sp.]
MQYVRPLVATTCVGQAGSPASLLLAGGAPGRRASRERARTVGFRPWPASPSSCSRS